MALMRPAPLHVAATHWHSHAPLPPGPRAHAWLLQALLTILDSPLNKAGLVKSVFVHTAKNVLIEVNPKV